HPVIGLGIPLAHRMYNTAAPLQSMRSPSFRGAALITCLVCVLFQVRSASAQPAQEFRWGGDAEGGAPFVEADPNDPSHVVGFDVEVAEQIARGLGRPPEFVQVTFTAIDQSVERGDFEIGMSGVEDTPPRRAAHAVTIP